MDLDRERIEEHLSRLGAAIGRPVTVVETTTSTNDDAKRAAADGATHGTTIVADSQSKGRGRGDHSWHSPSGENVYLSIVLRPHIAPNEVAPITLAVGLAVARVVERAFFGRKQAMLKWPNDVLVDGRKIAGVLVEGQLRGDRIASLVVGIGLNVRARSFPPELSDRATSLAIEGADELDRSVLTAAVIAEVGCVTDAYEAVRLAPLLREIRDLDALRDRPVEIGGVRGVGAGIDDTGRLLVQDANGGIVAMVSGEVQTTA